LFKRILGIIAGSRFVEEVVGMVIDERMCLDHLVERRPRGHGDKLANSEEQHC
jgi:hypothetical protein